MPRLTFGVQKLLNQWVNVNKDHVVYLDNSSSSLNAQKPSSSRKQRHPTSRSTKKLSDDYSIVTASTVSTSFTSSSASTNSSNVTSVTRGGGRSGRSQSSEFLSRYPNELNEKKAPLHSSSDVTIPLQELTFEERLRQGTFGATYKGKWRNKSVTIKVVTPIIPEDKWKDEINKFVDLTTNNEKMNVARFWGSSVLHPTRGKGGEIYCLISEHIVGMNLSDVLEYSPIPFAGAWKVMDSIARGMADLHSVNIMHGNLKPGNVLLRGDVESNLFDVKLVDYGISNFLKRSQDTINDKENIPYIAPEISEHKRISKASDVYSFAFLCWYLLTGEKPPIVAEKESRPCSPMSADSNLINLMEKCWDSNPESRPTFTFIVEALQTMKNRDEMSEGMGQTSYKMSQLSMKDDDEKKSSESLLSKITSSKKSRLLRRASPQRQIACKSRQNFDTEDVHAMTNSQRKRFLRLKRPKHSKSKLFSNELGASSEGLKLSYSSTPMIECKEPQPLTIKEEDAMSTTTDISEESETSIERGAPPYKKQVPAQRFSHEPAPRPGMRVPQGVKIENSHIAQGVPLIQPLLLGRPPNLNIIRSQGFNDKGVSGTKVVSKTEGGSTMFFYNHAQQNQCKGSHLQEPECGHKRSDSDPLHNFNLGKGLRRIRSANSFVVGKNTILEYVPSIAPAALKAPFPVPSSRHPMVMTSHVYTKDKIQTLSSQVQLDAKPQPVLSTILEKSMESSSSLQVNNQGNANVNQLKMKEEKKPDSMQISVVPSLCNDMSGAIAPKSTSLDTTHIIHKKSSATVTAAEPSCSSAAPLSSDANSLASKDIKQSANIISSEDEIDARLNAASVLYSQFSAKNRD